MFSDIVLKAKGLMLVKRSVSTEQPSNLDWKKRELAKKFREY